MLQGLSLLALLSLTSCCVFARVFDQSMQLLLIQRFLLKQCMRYPLQFLTVLREQLLDVCVAFADQLLYLLINQRGRLFGVALPLPQSNFPSQEHLLFAAQEHRADATAHPPARHHFPGQLWSLPADHSPLPS